MGRRNVKGTKSGKYMNPTDQARKEARKKELKKNKKQRLLVRTAVLKNKDPGMLMRELEKLDEIEYNPTPEEGAQQLGGKVLSDKRKKLKETLDRVMKLYQKDNPTYWSELKRLESEYERRRFHKIQYFEAVKQAESVSNVEDIPLPDMPAPPTDGGVSEIPLPDGSVSAPTPAVITGIPMPAYQGEVHGILKKSLPMLAIAPGTPTFQGRDPPGVPVGPPPDLSEMDELSDDEIEEEQEKPKAIDNKTKSVRFSDSAKDGEDEAMSEMDRFMREVEEEFNSKDDEDLQPPGTEDGIPIPSRSLAQNSNDQSSSLEESDQMPQDVHMEDDTAKLPPATSLAKPETAAEAASAIAAASSSIRPPIPQGSFYPPPPGMPPMPYPRGPPMPMMRPNFQPPSGHRFIPPSAPPMRFRQPPRPNLDSQPGKGEGKIVSGSMIQAKPQIRSLSVDVTRFIPTAVKTKKDEPEKPRRQEYQIGQSQMHFKEPQPPKPQLNKDDAYADFMKEMQGLM